MWGLLFPYLRESFLSRTPSTPPLARLPPPVRPPHLHAPVHPGEEGFGVLPKPPRRLLQGRGGLWDEAEEATGVC